MMHGGQQEKGARSSTENVHAILGMDTALAIAYENLEADVKYITSLKQYFIEELTSKIKNIQFNGRSSNIEKSTYTIVNVRLPIVNTMLLFNLDILGVAVSGGSACQSGSNKGSHVLNSFLIGDETKKASVRFSFSKYTTVKDVNFALQKIYEFCK